MKHLQGKRGVVTGGGSGIGLAIARALAEAGMPIALIDRDVGRLAAAAEALPAGTTTHQADVADFEAVREAQAVIAASGDPSVLINAAGVSVAGAFAETSLEDFRWLMDINLGGTVHCCKAFLPAMLARGEGHIVNVSSSFGLVGFPGKSAYAASKFAVRGFSESLRMELRGSGVGVTVLYPGPVDTNILRNGRAASETQRTNEAAFLASRAIPPERVARATLRGIQRDAPRVLLSADYRALDWLARLSPALALYLVGRIGNTQVNG
ncbi:MAG: SDR family NAD(P)-dependent oxidoreductase [Candidatus Hydrogenedens sp.]|nr:SDR family NAD(P)-dependent oxidoreductase [Candidatus Hydrogenedens sp.]